MYPIKICPSIREEADVDRVANALLQKIELAERRG